MTADAPYRRLVSALYVLVRTAGVEGDGQALSAAAAAAESALQAALHGETHFVLQERCGALFANGVQLRFDADSYAAMAAMADVLERTHTGEMLLMPQATAADLAGWAMFAAGRVPAQASPDTTLQALGVRGIHASPHAAAAPTGGPANDPAAAGVTVTSANASQLRAVFLQRQLAHALDPRSPFANSLARAVLSATVDELMASVPGTTALMALVAADEVAATAAHTCVVATELGRAIGCGDRLLAEIAAAALLHDLGRALPAEGPAPLPAALRANRWFLRHGDDPLWLRCAFVARTWNEIQGGSLDEVMLEGSLTGALVRVAVRFDELLRQQGRDADAVGAALQAEARAGAFPQELVAALLELLAPAPL